MVRLPDGLRNEIQGAADYLDTSMNTVFVQAVRQYLDNQQRQQLLLNALNFAVLKKNQSDELQTDLVAVVAALQQDLNQRDERIGLL